ncbi:MAG: hypothetical protein ABIQ09_05325 [Jatrophihabitantaceae bacterium]
MKRALVLLLLLAATVSLWRSVVIAEGADRTRALQSAARLGPSFQIPPDTELANPDRALRGFELTAEQLHVNVFTTRAGYTAGNKSLITQYMLLTGPTGLYENLRLESGKWPTPAQTREGGSFVASSRSASSLQIGTVASFANATDISVRALPDAYKALPVAGLYFVEFRGDSTGSYDDFIAELAQQLTLQNGLSTPLDPHRLVPNGTVRLAFPAPVTTPLTLAGWGLVAAVCLLSIYRALSIAKTAGVMRLHGFTTLQAWYVLNGRVVLYTMAVALTGTCVAAALISDADRSFVVGNVLAMLYLTVIMLAATVFAGVYLAGIRLAESIKNRKDTRSIFTANIAFKVLCGVTAVLVGATVWAQYAAAQQEINRLGNWSTTSDYGIFYPTSVGNDLIAAQSDQAGATYTEAVKLYPMLNSRGALYVDATQFSSVIAPAQSSGTPVYKSLTVNPNYLSVYPVRGADGRSITVSEQTSDWLLLVPARYHGQEVAIRSFFQDQRKSAYQAEAALFGGRPSMVVQNQQLRILWTADGQQAFSFDPDVEPNNGNRIKDPIMQVATLQNSLGIDRANAITGGANTALKVHLQQSDAAATLRELRPTLVQLGLDQQLTHLVTMNAYMIAQADSFRSTARVLLLIGLGVVLASLALILQSTVIAFERYGRRAAVRRLFGATVVGQYRELLVVFALSAVTQAAIVLGCQVARIQLGTGTGFRPSTTTVVFIAVALTGIEFAVLAATLRKTGYRRFTRVLKESF